MPHFFRNAFPYLAGGLLLAVLAWALSFGTLPEADFTFDNGNEIQTLDAALATGQPEHRVINGLFEGLLANAPESRWQDKYGLQDLVPMTPQPGMAEWFEISEDGLTYTFHMRREAKWSDGTAVTADDFAWSWMRTLHPETGGQYAYQLYYIVGAQQYNTAQIEPGGKVEVELADRRRPLQLFPRGTILRGALTSLYKPPEPVPDEGASDDDKDKAIADWKKKWVYVVAFPGEAAPRMYAKDPTAARMAQKQLRPAAPPLDKLERCLHVLPDFAATVGVKAESPLKLVVKLNSRTPFFADLVAFYPLYAVNRRCIETHGSPDWTRPENIVGNGAFKLDFRRIRDRIRMVKNEHYWDAANVELDMIDALSVKSETTSLNMYLKDQIDWASTVPNFTIPKLKAEFPTQFRNAPMLTTYFYRLNVTRKELSDKRVRRALAMAIDKEKICTLVTRAGEMPATALVPPGLAGYDGPLGVPFDIEGARKLLAEAGHAGGRNLPRLEIMYNAPPDRHQKIAEAVQQMWRENLGIDAHLRGLEWGVYLASQHKLDYAVCRAGWVADYADPNTFLDMFVTNGGNNNTGWSNPRYDELIAGAAAETDPARRMEMFREAETILLEEQPIIPIYFDVSKSLVSPRVEGFFNNVQDDHPLKLLRVKK